MDETERLLSGIKHQERARRNKPRLPAIVMGNVRFLSNKMDELMVLLRLQGESRECSIMCFIQLWIHVDFPDSVVSLNGLTLLQTEERLVSS